jgi:hypothetical protein
VASAREGLGRLFDVLERPAVPKVLAVRIALDDLAKTLGEEDFGRACHLLDKYAAAVEDLARYRANSEKAGQTACARLARLRARGFRVVAHADWRAGDLPYTTWVLESGNGRLFKASGASDAACLEEVERKSLEATPAEPPAPLRLERDAEHARASRVTADTFNALLAELRETRAELRRARQRSGRQKNRKSRGDKS